MTTNRKGTRLHRRSGRRGGSRRSRRRRSHLRRARLRRHDRPPGDRRRRALSPPRRRQACPSPRSCKRTAKGVVEITVTSAGQSSPFGGDGQAQQAQGSGFVLDEQGHIVTNQHVVDGAQSVTVKFSDGSTYDATVVGSDPSTDLAVIKVDAPASLLVPLELADSSQVAGRRRRGRDRQPVRARSDRHDGHRQRPPPRDHGAEQLRDRGRDPDRRRDQPRQLRRAAARPPRVT